MYKIKPKNKITQHIVKAENCFTVKHPVCRKCAGFYLDKRVLNFNFSENVRFLAFCVHKPIKPAFSASVECTFNVLFFFNSLRTFNLKKKRTFKFENCAGSTDKGTVESTIRAPNGCLTDIDLTYLQYAHCVLVTRISDVCVY